MYEHGGDIYTYKNCIDFSASINPLGMPEAVREAAEAGARCSDVYPDVKCRRLKEAIAARDGIKEEWIFCGNGAADVIFTLVYALRPKEALLAIPSFFEYERALISAGCRIDKYVCVPDNGFALREDFLNRITGRTDVVFLCNPNNPTGTLTDGALLAKITERCEATGTYLLLDECFVDFLPDWRERTRMGKVKEHPHLVIIRSFTKMYAMPGLRLGYCAARDEGLVRKMETVSQPWRVSVPAMLAGIAAAGEREFQEYTGEYIKEERSRLIRELTRAGYEVYGSAANFIFFHGEEGLAPYAQERGFLIRDCGNYDGLSGGYYRAAVRTGEENERLAKVLFEFRNCEKQ